MGLSVNPCKTTLVAFTRKRNVNLKDIYFFGHKLTYSQEVKYLGIFFDSKMSWKKHFDYCVSKAKRIFWSCRNAVGKTWGLDPKCVLWIYNMIICPIICYGAIAWWHRANLETSKEVLNKLQRMVCLTLTGAFRTTPTAAMELLLGLLPLHLRIEEEAIMTRYRFISLGCWRHYSQYLCWGKLKANVINSPLLCMPNDALSLKFSFHRPFKIDFPSRELWSGGFCGRLGDGLVWFTDGSKLNGRVGSGIFCLNNKQSFAYSLGVWPTVFQAEVYAILMCCYLCLDSNIRSRNIFICSDSQAALKALGKCCFTSKLVWECFCALCELSVSNRVNLLWVPGHAGIAGNESADEIAREGSTLPFWAPEPALGISIGTVRHGIRAALRDLQFDTWLSSKGQRQAKEFCRTCPRRARELLSLGRNGLRKALGLLTGHYTFRRHLTLMGIGSDANCRFCGLVLETSAHLLCECEALAAARLEHLGDHSLTVDELQFIPVSFLLSFTGSIGLR